MPFCAQRKKAGDREDAPPRTIGDPGAWVQGRSRGESRAFRAKEAAKTDIPTEAIRPGEGAPFAIACRTAGMRLHAPPALSGAGAKDTGAVQKRPTGWRRETPALSRRVVPRGQGADGSPDTRTPCGASGQNDVLDELMDRGSAVLDSKGEVQYTGPVKQEKRLDVVIGPPAAGKSSALVDPISREYGSRVLDSDDVKARLPEFDGGLNSSYLHNESRLVWKKMQARAVALGDNVVLPIVGGKQSSVEKTIQPYLDAGYSINLHYMELDANKAIGRGLNRYLSNGRYIEPPYLFNANNGGVEATYEAMKSGGSIDGYSKWDNDVPWGHHPRFVEGTALRELYERGPADTDTEGLGGSGGMGQGARHGTGSPTETSSNPSQIRETLKYSKNTPQQPPPQGVSSTPKGAPKQSPARIAKDLVRALGLGDAVGTKRMNHVPQAVAGYYETRARYIAVRSSQAGNYTVTMHEVFHYLAERLNMTGTTNMVNSLDPVFAASYDPAELPGEAFAEFGWRYMESEELARQFAGDAFVDQFEARLRQAGLHKPVHRAARQLRIWLNATVNDRIGATIVDKSRASRPGSIRVQLQALISKHVDDTAAAEPVNAAIREATGQNRVPLNQDVRANALMKNFGSVKYFSQNGLQGLA